LRMFLGDAVCAPNMLSSIAIQTVRALDEEETTILSNARPKWMLLPPHYIGTDASSPQDAVVPGQGIALDFGSAYGAAEQDFPAYEPKTTKVSVNLPAQKSKCRGCSDAFWGRRRKGRKV
jgi:hypothetical protein